jgi:two-component system sensor histidine kinase/response regulator
MSDQQTDALRGNILIVDDTSHIRTLLAHMLISQGHEVQAVNSGPEALETARETPFDLILLDIMMPDMDGYEVCQQLKADPQTRDIPVIFISALERVDDKVKAFGSGGVDYIPKPFQMKEVVARVTTHLSLRALQQRLAVQLEELKARNEELDALARTIARDLKTPLTSIIGFADMLDDIGPTMAEKDLHDSLRTIASNARKMDGIIDELLFLAGLRQVGHTDLGPLDMDAVVDGALGRLADLIEEHQADIIRPDTWPTALGYGPWVEEVWVKFIGDAIAHGAKPPQIELGATADEEGDLRFWVRDNGPSMTVERQRGVGMVVVRRIIEKLGRDFSLESAGEEGNILSFTLRAA